MSIPPKHIEPQVVGYMKGKNAIGIARELMGRCRNFSGKSFWARGYYVLTVGLDEEAVRAYVLCQENEKKRLEQLRLPTI